MWQLVFLKFIDLFILAFNLLILIRVVASWINPGTVVGGWMRLVYELTEPVLGRVRRLLPRTAFLDLSPLVTFFLLQILQAAAHRFLGPALI